MTVATEIKERPILFSGEMVRAILEGRKTQTRRVCKGAALEMLNDGFTPEYVASPGNAAWNPYGQPGDRLWVRESMGRWEDGEWFYKADTKVVTVPSDRTDDVTALRVWAHHKESPHCPSIHMPRWASRLTLEITTVRVERVQEINDKAIIAEGTQRKNVNRSGKFSDCWRWSFAELWDSINAKRGFGWDVNPWVWVIEFRPTMSKPQESRAGSR